MSDEENREYRLKRFHHSIALATFPFYLLIRQKDESLPELIKNLLDTKAVELSLILVAAAAILYSMFQGFMLQLELEEKELFGLGLVFDIRNYQLHYYLPYLVPLFLIIFLEIIIRFV